MNSSPSHYDAHIARITPMTPSIQLLELQLVDPRFQFKPGQWIELSVDKHSEVSSGAFSISSAPGSAGRIELALRHTDGSAITEYLARHAKPGDRVTLSAARGQMAYEAGDVSGDIILIGGGTGIAPLMSILRYLHQNQSPAQRIVLFYSTGSEEEILFARELQDLQNLNPDFECFITLTRDWQTNWQGLTGRIDAAMLNQTAHSAEAIYYLCGPPDMVDAVVDLLTQRAVPAERLRYDKWW